MHFADVNIIHVGVVIAELNDLDESITIHLGRFPPPDANQGFPVILPRIKICEKDEWRFSRNRVILVVSE
jgi:hypothetical protein